MRTVLIVEDVPEMAALLRTLIEGIPGVRVIGVARDLGEARASLPDGILLDEVLPGGSSWDWVEELKARPETARVAIAFLSGMTTEASRNRGFPSGVNQRFEKPWGEGGEGASQKRLRRVTGAEFQKQVAAWIRSI
jgi:DNA-binding response OmpR family regulator